MCFGRLSPRWLLFSSSRLFHFHLREGLLTCGPRVTGNSVGPVAADTLLVLTGILTRWRMLRKSVKVPSCICEGPSRHGLTGTVMVWEEVVARRDAACLQEGDHWVPALHSYVFSWASLSSPCFLGATRQAASATVSTALTSGPKQRPYLHIDWNVCEPKYALPPSLAFPQALSHCAERIHILGGDPPLRHRGCSPGVSITSVTLTDATEQMWLLCSVCDAQSDYESITLSA